MDPPLGRVDPALAHEALESGGDAELDVLFDDVAGLDRAPEAGHEFAADTGDEVFRGRGSGGEQDGDGAAVVGVWRSEDSLFFRIATRSRGHATQAGVRRDPP